MKYAVAAVQEQLRPPDLAHDPASPVCRRAGASEAYMRVVMGLRCKHARR
jgi:hypothetical protein